MDIIGKLTGVDIVSLIKETYALETKFKELKDKLVSKLENIKKELQGKLEKHNTKLVELKAEYEKKLLEETKSFESGTFLSAGIEKRNAEIAEIESAVKYLDKILKNFDAIQNE